MTAQEQLGLGELLEHLRVATGPMSTAEIEWCIRLSPWYYTHSSGDPLWNEFCRALQGSIDAALALTERMLPKGCNLVLKLQTGGAYFHTEIETDEGGELTAYNHPTLPLAILAALLTALLNTKENGE